MAEFFDPSKTEAPTQHRRDEARQEGQVALSNDLASSVVLLAGLAVLMMAARSFGGNLLESVRNDMSRLGQLHELEPEQVAAIFWAMFSKALELLGFLMGLVFVMAAAAGAFQVGFHITPHLLTFNMERLS